MSFKTLAQLLDMVAGLERDLGLDQSLPVERDVIVVIGAFIEGGEDFVKTEMLIKHPLLAGVPRSTLHRALRSVLDKGMICHAEGSKAGRYVLCCS